MRLNLKNSQLTLVFFPSRSFKSLNHFLTKSPSPRKSYFLLGWYSYALVFIKDILNISHFPFAMTTKRPFLQFHSPFSSTDDPFGPSKRTVSSHHAFLPVVTQEKPFPGHRYYWQGASFLLPSMQPVYLTWQYYSATHFYREDGSSMSHCNVDSYLED